MSTYAPTILPDRRTAPDYVVLSPFVANAITFWVPLAIIVVAMFGVQHSWDYSSPSYVEGQNFRDLVAEVGNSSLGRQLGLLTIGAIGALMMMTRSRQPIAVNVRLACMLAALASWVILSALWADDMELSLKRAVQPVLLIVAALGVTKHWQPRQVCLFTAMVTGGILLLGIASACIQGSLLLGEAYRFTGTLHSNLQATNCAALCLASLALFLEPQSQGASQYRWRWLILFVIGFVFLCLTRSRTTTTAMLAALVPFFLLGASYKRTFVVGYVLILIAAIGAALLLLGEGDTRGAFFNVMQMGREDDMDDATSLTGRIPVWRLAMWDIAERPLCGYGCGAYWTSQRVLDYSYNCHWEPTHAHSAYLETMLNVGAIGLAMGLILIGSATWAAVRIYTQSHDAGYRFIVAVLFMAMVQGILDSNFVLIGFDALLVLICISSVILHDRPDRESVANTVLPALHG